jgi:sodium/potassium-transporting ATPase subunit alpha
LIKGLTQAQVYAIQKRDGLNVLTPQRRRTKLKSFLANLFGGFGILLIIGACLCFIAYGIHAFKNDDQYKESLWLGISLLAVDFVSGCFSFYQV